jgi:CRISPR-associated protein Cmr2
MSIGPVQTFVAQSQRTRDLWASSYLLSFLSAKAMHRAAAAGGVIVSPQMEGNALWRWLAAPASELPTTGSVPNQFTIAVREGGDGRALAEEATRGFLEAWNEICAAVWREYLQDSGAETRAIWERQVTGFWELAWITDDREVPLGLRARKAWRTLELPDEPGDKCTVLPELQELSGEIRAQGPDARKRQDAFWARLGEAKRVGALDLDPKARLCAIALVKRLFPRVAKSALKQRLDRVTWPSSVDLAAIPWCERVLAAGPAPARAFAQAVLEVRGNSALSGGVSEQVKAPSGVDAGAFTSIDTNWLHASYLKTAELEPPLAAGDRSRLAALLQDLHETVDAMGRPLGAPPIYFALLLADGDQLGKLREPLGAARLSAALGQFSSGVEMLVREHRGVTVYAGGDDVLALLPIDRALDCAAALERDYRAAFDRAAFENMPQATLSAAVVFAHARASLDQVLGSAHRLLADVAKEANGRASLVVAVTRRRDPAAQWVTTWQRSGTAQWVTTWQRSGTAAVLAIDELTRTMATDQRLLSGSLDHAIWEMLRQLGGGVDWRPGTFARVDACLDLKPLIHAAVLQSLSHRDVNSADAEAVRLTALIHPLLEPARNEPARDPDVPRSDSAERVEQEVGLDALLVARFLAGGGLEGEHQS